MVIVILKTFVDQLLKIIFIPLCLVDGKFREESLFFSLYMYRFIIMILC